MFERGLETLTTMLGDRRVTPAVPAGRTAAVTIAEATPAPAARDASSSWSAFIVYVDASGAQSQRRFTCQQISGFAGATHIYGFCHERGALRQLRVDRIAELVCVETGEILHPAEHFAMLRSTGALGVADPVLTDVTRILTFLARCDGDYHPVERAAIEDHVGRYCVRFDGTDRLAEDALRNCGRLAPDAGDVVSALKRLGKRKDGAQLARFLLACGAEVIDADGRHAPQETAWAIEMSEALKKVATR